MLSIQAVRGLPRLRTPGVVTRVIRRGEVYTRMHDSRRRLTAVAMH